MSQPLSIAALTYRWKEEEARLAQALDDSRIVSLRIAEPAIVPSDPEPTGIQRSLFIAIALSLGGGTLLAFVRDWWNPSIK